MTSISIDKTGAIVLHPITRVTMSKKRANVGNYVNVLINPVTGRPTNLVYIVAGVILIWIIYVNHYRGSSDDVSNPKLSKHGDERLDEFVEPLALDRPVKFNPDLIPFQHLVHPRQDMKAILPPEMLKHGKKEIRVPPDRENLPRPMPKKFPVDLQHKPLVNSLKCPMTTYVLVIITTLPSEVKLRNAIRRTWGSPKNFGEIKITGLSWMVIFAVGNGDSEQDKIIAAESEDYGDVLQGRFDDTGVEDTRKTMMVFKWITDWLLQYQGCRPAFVLKAPAKVYIHIPKVLDWIAHTVKDLQKVYRGKLLRRDEPIRVEEDPLYVSPEDYAKDTFPDMIRNPVYLFSTDVIEQMVTQFTKITPIAMEDSYIGLLANSTGIKPVDDEHFLLMQRPSNICHYKHMMFVYNVAPSEQVHVFNVVEKGHMADHCNDDRGL